MENELLALEDKITQVVALCKVLRAENQLLQQQLADARAENTALVEKMNTAREQLETLAGNLPETTTPV